MKVVYDGATNELVGLIGDDEIAAEPPPKPQLNSADAPENYKDYPRRFWVWNGVDAIVLKTGQALADAQAEFARPGQKTKWRTKARVLVKKLKAGTASDKDRAKALELVIIYSMEMYDEDEDDDSGSSNDE